MNISAQNLQLEWQTRLDDFVTKIAWSPNGTNWVGSSAAGQIIWVSEDREPVGLRESDGYSIDDLSYSADGCWLAAGGRAGELSIWNCVDVNLPPQLVSTVTIGTWIEHLDWHPTEPHLAVAAGRNIKIWDAAADRELITWRFDKSSVLDLAWHPDGEYLAVGGYKGVQIWARMASAPSHRFDVDTATTNISWSEDGRYLVSANLDRTLTIVDWHHPQDPWILQGCPGKIHHLTWLKSETTCLAVASGTALLFWTLTSDTTEWIGQVLEGHQGAIGTICAHPQDPTIVSGDTDGYACLWSATGDIQQIMTSDLSEYTVLIWHPQGKYLATGTRMGEIGLWSA